MNSFKSLKSFLSKMLVTVMLTSCVNVGGHLDLKLPMAAKKKSGFLNLKTTEIQIQPDLYNAQLTFLSGKNYTLKLTGRETISIPIKSSSDLHIPTNGPIFISHNNINQPFDLKGFIRTDVSETSRYNDLEDCTVTFTENHCQKICEKPETCSIVCKDEQVTIHGRREVLFHFRTTDRNISFEFQKADKGEALGQFTGQGSETEKINDFVGACRR
jgi:hypothetical protein